MTGPSTTGGVSSRQGPAGSLTSLLRIVPMHLYAGRAHVVMERAVRVYKTSWLVVLSGFFEPLFYLLAMGKGLGSLIGQVQNGSTPVTYAAYIAPALLATSAMNGAISDSTNNVFFKMRYAKLYDGMLATSLGPVDVALGEIVFSLVRGGLYSTAFLIVMLALGLLTSWWALLALPMALVIAFGFAAIGMAITSYLKSWQQLAWIGTALLPMFLFSTTFYPLGVYPRPVQLLVEALPLYHGIELMRGLCLGPITPDLFLHALYFGAMIVVGVVLTSYRLEKLLLR